VDIRPGPNIWQRLRRITVIVAVSYFFFFLIAHAAGNTRTCPA
jgi:hypothetical protein